MRTGAMGRAALVVMVVMVAAILGVGCGGGPGPGGGPETDGGGSGGHGGSGGDAGTGGSGGQDGGGGDAGMCATKACAVPADCPATMNECVQATCDPTKGCCGTQDVAMGTKTSTQTPGSCHAKVCDGMGNVTSVIDPTNKPADVDACHTGGCNVSGTPAQTPKPAGTACAFGGSARKKLRR
jgi:hypothetical protein